MTQLSQSETTLTLAGLQAALRAVSPGVVLVPTWVLREVISHDQPRGPGFWVPRQQTYGIDRSRLEKLVRRERLPLDSAMPREDWLTLLPCPESTWLACMPASLVLRHYWRFMFHARVLAAVRRESAARQASAANGRRQSFEQLPPEVFHEIRLVLSEERLLRVGADAAGVYAEFVALFAELYYFDRPALGRYFPCVAGGAGCLESIGASIDIDGLWRETRPAGAADAVNIFNPEAPDCRDPAEIARNSNMAREAIRAHSAEARHAQDAMLTSAERAAAVGNDVRAAILHERAFQLGGTRAGINHAGRDLDALVARLAAIRELAQFPVAPLAASRLASTDQPIAKPQAANQPVRSDLESAWRQALRPLLAPSARGWWGRDARLLYDLQKACIENEREVYSVNLVEWVLDLGRRPLRRPLPRQRLVLLVKHLRSAEHWLTRVRLSAPARARLAGLLRDAAHAAESNLHAQFYPVVMSALLEAGLRPRGDAEAVALNKLVEELLDGIARKGFLSLGDLRDALSRNAFKLDDLRGAGEFVHGDPLLRIDRALAVELDGVYRRGEFYRRAFQRVSSVLFGTHAGRIITRTILMPFGGAYLVLEGLEHTIGLLVHLIFKIRLDLGAGFHGLPKHGGPPEGWKIPGLTLYVDHPLRYVLTALLFFLLANWPAFRVAARSMFRRAFHSAKRVLIGLPRWLISRPLVRAIAQSRATRLAIRYGVKPLALSAVAAVALPRSLGLIGRLEVGGCVFVAANLLLNSRHVRALEGALLHRLRLGWEKLTGNILAGLYHMVMGFFERVLEDVDRMLYQVDEWLRFRAEQGRGAFVAKAVIGVFWFYIAYFVRFVINLLVEPQVNPIKHFPVVTVSHKIILPQAPRLAGAFEALGIARARAVSLAVPIVFVIPGIFGFLAWELLSNWKLYKANRPPVLKPVQVGSHGESISRLLRPGIHSGTIPKIFARLRRAGARERSGRRSQKHLHALEHVREAVEHFLERELVVRLNRHPAWRDTPVSLGEVTLTPTSIVAELTCAPAAPQSMGIASRAETERADIPMRLSFWCWSGWVVAGFDGPGWASTCTPNEEKAALLSLALSGLYKLAGVDLDREQVAAALAEAFATSNGDASTLPWDVQGKDLVVWPSDGIELHYELTEGLLIPRLAEETNKSAQTGSYPILDSRKLLLQQRPIAWNDWAQSWEPAHDPSAEATRGAPVLSYLT